MKGIVPFVGLSRGAQIGFKSGWSAVYIGPVNKGDAIFVPKANKRSTKRWECDEEGNMIVNSDGSIPAPSNGIMYREIGEPANRIFHFMPARELVSVPHLQAFRWRQ